MSRTWEETDHDETSGRRIFTRSADFKSGGSEGTYSFRIEEEFQVRTAEGEVLMQQTGSAKGEYWCGAFMFFVDGAEGKRVRIDESDSDEDTFLDVPDVPLPKEDIWE